MSQLIQYSVSSWTLNHTIVYVFCIVTADLQVILQKTFPARLDRCKNVIFPTNRLAGTRNKILLQPSYNRRTQTTVFKLATGQRSVNSSQVVESISKVAGQVAKFATKRCIYNGQKLQKHRQQLQITSNTCKKLNPTNLKLGLVTLYDFWPGN